MFQLCFNQGVSGFRVPRRNWSEAEHKATPVWILDGFRKISRRVPPASFNLTGYPSKKESSTLSYGLESNTGIDRCLPRIGLKVDGHIRIFRGYTLCFIFRRGT